MAAVITLSLVLALLACWWFKLQSWKSWAVMIAIYLVIVPLGGLILHLIPATNQNINLHHPEDQYLYCAWAALLALLIFTLVWPLLSGKRKGRTRSKR